MQLEKYSNSSIDNIDDSKNRIIEAFDNLGKLYLDDLNRIYEEVECIKNDTNDELKYDYLIRFLDDFDKKIDIVNWLFYEFTNGNVSSYSADNLMKVIDYIERLLRCNSEYMIKDDEANRIEIDNSIFVYPLRLKTFFRVLEFLNDIKKKYNEYSFLFKWNFDDLVNNINELSFDFFIWELSDKNKYYSDKYNLDESLYSEDILFSSFLRKIIFDFEENIESQLWYNTKDNLEYNLRLYKNDILLSLDENNIHIPDVIRAEDEIRKFPLRVKNLLVDINNEEEDHFFNKSYIEFWNDDDYRYYKLELSRKILEWYFRLNNSIIPNIFWKKD